MDSYVEALGLQHVSCRCLDVWHGFVFQDVESGHGVCVPRALFLGIQHGVFLQKIFPKWPYVSARNFPGLLECSQHWPPVERDDILKG